MILLFVTRKNSLQKQRFVARDGVSWKDSLQAIVEVQDDTAAKHSDFKVEFPTEEEFFGVNHTAAVSVI